MKESKKRDHSIVKKEKKSSSPLNLDSWNHTNLEEESEQSLEMRRHLLKMQLAQEGTSSHNRHSSAKRKKKRLSEDTASSDSNSSHSRSSFSSASSSSVNKYKSKKSSSLSEDEKKKFLRSSLPKKKHLKDVKSSRSSHDYKVDKKIIVRRKASPTNDKSSRNRARKSPSLDKRDLYSRLDTGRWHEKAKEFEKERSRGERDDVSRSRGRADRNRSVSPRRDSRHASRTKDDRPHPKKQASRTVSSSSMTRRKDSPEPARTRTTYDSGRRTAATPRKVSPRDDRLGRHDERRLDLKVARRNDVRSGDARDANLRVARDARDRKEAPPPKPLEKSRERALHRDVADHSRADRERSKTNDDRAKERDKRLAHDRLESERNVRSGTRDLGDENNKFRRNERSNAVVDAGRLSNNRHPVAGSTGESVFDRMRNRYNDRRNAENQRLGRERPPVDVRKERPEVRPADMNGAASVDRLAPRDRRLSAVVTPAAQLPALMSLRSGINLAERRTPPPLMSRERKEPERNAVERRSPPSFDHKFTSPLATRRSRDLEHRTNVKRRSSVEHDDPAWARKKGLNKLRSRSRSSEKRKRRRSSQEEWRIIDMTSPVLDDEFSDENIGTSENLPNKLKHCVANKLSLKSEDSVNADQDKSNLNDELSDISDEDFNDVNGTSALRIKRESIVKNDRVVIKTEENCTSAEQKASSDREDFDFEKTASLPAESKPALVANDVDVLFKTEKLTDEEENGRAVDMDKAGAENFDSEEETVSRVSDALGVDWADLVEESKRKAACGAELNASSVRRRWNTAIVFAKIGVSEKYAGEDVFDDLQLDLEREVAGDNSNSNNTKVKMLHKIPALHTCLKAKAVKRQTLFEPYKTAISARKDIAIRRRLCGLPVKNLPSQQMIGICHWIV